MVELATVLPSLLSQSLAFSSAIKFDRPTTVYTPPTITGSSTPVAFTADFTNALVGAVSVVRLASNGSNTPNFGTIKVMDGGSWDNRSGIVNVLQFLFLGGTDVWVSITQEANASAADTIAPTLLSAVVANASPSNVVLTFSENLATQATPISAFTVSGKTITAFSQSGTSATLTVSAAFTSGQNASVSYTQPTSNRLQDAAGNQVANIGLTAITNNVGGTDTTPPTLVSAIVANAAQNDVVLTFSETLGTQSTPISAFTISGKTITAFAQSGATVTLTVGNGFVLGQTATVTYTQPTSARLQDVGGNQVANIAATSITNNVTLTTIPLTVAQKWSGITVTGTIYSVSANGYFGTVLFNQALPANTDGYVEIGVPTGNVVMGFNLTNALHWYAEPTNGYEYAILPDTAVGFWRSMTNGIFDPFQTTVASGAGATKRMRLRRTAGVISAEISNDGTTFTTFKTWPGTQNAALYVNLNFDTAISTTSSPIGEGVV